MDKLLRRAEVEMLTGLGRSAIYAKMRAGTFPEPYQIGPNAVRWKASEIETWIDNLEKSHGHRAA